MRIDKTFNLNSSHSKTSFFADLVFKYDENDVSTYKKDIFNYDYKPWDVSKSFNLEEVQEDNAILKAKFEGLKNGKKSNYPLLFLILGIIGIFIAIPLFFFLGVYAIFIAVIAFAPYTILKSNAKKISIDLIKFSIAQKNELFYDPYPKKDAFYTLKGTFPELFKRGDENQYVEDQFWGISSNKKNYFYGGLFSYDEVTRDSKGRKSRTTYKKHFFGISLQTPSDVKFYLYPENVFSKIGNMFTKKEINTESIEFNKKFAFDYNGSKDEKGIHITKTLSPAVQEKLVDLTKKKKNVRVLFYQNTIMFMFDGIFFKQLHTNLLSKPEVDQRDIDFFDKEVNELVDIGTSISEYIS